MCVCVMTFSSDNWLSGKKHHGGSDDNYSAEPEGEKEN